MKNKIILITGATSGIGKYTAISLASMGATVIVTGRSQQNGEDAIKEIKAISKSDKIDLILADISTIAGIKSLVREFTSKYDHLDVLINNAGLAANEYKKTIDGFEANFAVNVIAPYLLTTLLMDSLKASETARVITLTGGDLPSKIQLDNLQSEKSFNGLSTYSQTKIVMMCLMYEYSKRQFNSGVTMNICYPGQASTSMTQNVTADMLPFLMRPIFPVFKLLVRPDNGKSAKKASRSSVYLATSKEVENRSGIYCNKHVQLKEMPKAVTDVNNRQYIWNYVNGLIKDKL
jgi:NAD(P)-dependent dehydrogenase (short-subunit alcohol dehydrogenase family)